MNESNPYEAPKINYDAPQISPSKADTTEPKGIGGWLILVAIGIVITPFRLGATILLTFVPMFTQGAWEVLTSPDSAHYNPMWAPIILGEFIGNVIFAIAYVVLAVLFFKKSRYFPQTFIVLAISNLLFVGLDAVLISSIAPAEVTLDADTGKEIARSFFGVAIWVPYMLMSKRVKNTFVE